MVLYLSTKFGILKPWTIISKLIRFDLGFWQTSKQVYRELKYRENVLEEFLYLPHFPRKIVLYSSIKFGILKPWTIIFKFIRFDLGFWQTLKQVYRKIKCMKKVLEKLQRLPGFSRKIILCSSTKFGILKPWTSISKLIRFNLGFWQTSKQIYKKLKYREKVLEEFQRLPHFPKKMVSGSSTKFWISKPSTITSKLIKIDLDFWQTLKQIYRKLKYKETVLEEFHRLPQFTRKMVLYSSTKFGILKPWTIISKLIRFDLGFWQSSKQVYRKCKYREKVLEEFQRFPRFFRKMVLYSSTKFRILKP